MFWIIWQKGKGYLTLWVILAALAAGWLLSYSIAINPAAMLGYDVPLLTLAGTRWIGFALIIAAFVNARIAKHDVDDSSLYSIPIATWSYLIGAAGVVLFLFNPESLYLWH